MTDTLSETEAAQRDNKKTVVSAAEFPCVKTKYSSLAAVLK